METMTDTPETDAVNTQGVGYAQRFYAMKAHARKLERERDEWQINALLKLAVKQLACMWCGEVVHAPTGYEPGTPLSEEQRGQAYREHVATCQKHPIRDVERERDKLRAWTSVNGVSQLAQERDAAIAELEAWRSEKGPEGWWVKHSDHMAQLEEWRDEKAGLKDLLENTITDYRGNRSHESQIAYKSLNPTTHAPQSQHASSPSSPPASDADA